MDKPRLYRRWRFEVDDSKENIRDTSKQNKSNINNSINCNTETDGSSDAGKKRSEENSKMFGEDTNDNQLETDMDKETDLDKIEQTQDEFEQADDEIKVSSTSSTQSSDNLISTNDGNNTCCAEQYTDNSNESFSHFGTDSSTEDVSNYGEEYSDPAASQDSNFTYSHNPVDAQLGSNTNIQSEEYEHDYVSSDVKEFHDSTGNRHTKDNDELEENYSSSPGTTCNMEYESGHSRKDDEEDYDEEYGENYSESSNEDYNESYSEGYDEDYNEEYDEDYNEEHDNEFGEEEDNSVNQYGDYNTERVYDLIIEKIKLQKLQVNFSRLISLLAEDMARYPIPGDEEWDTHLLMLRSFDKRPLRDCRIDRERERIVLILDTSGSCYHMANFYSKIAALSAKLGDIEIYDAPNGYIERKWDHKNNNWNSSEYVTHLNGEDRSWNFKNRVIFFFGDFDGGDYIVRSSIKNKIVWFSCEDRYSDMDEHSWCSYTLKDFRGLYFECFSEDDITRIVRKIRSGCLLTK